jgi:D-amino peptidase
MVLMFGFEYRIVLCAALLLALAGSPAAGQSRGLRVYISADMEGLAGVVSADQLGPSGFEYGLGREIMTREVLAAIAGARAAGATEFLISDSHGNGENILIDMLPDNVQIVRSWPRPLMMMQGIDSSFDAALLIGNHSGTTNPAGVRAHTISSGRLADVRLNGASVPEAVLSAAVAGHFGVPVVMISGDDAAVAEAQTLLRGLEGAVVKWNYSYESARTLTPAAAERLIEETARGAVARLRDVPPYRLGSPVTLDLRFKSYRPSQLLAYLPIVERTDAHSIRYVADDILAVSRFLEFVMSYEVGLEP